MLFCISNACKCSDYFCKTWPENFSFKEAPITFLPGIINFSEAWCRAESFVFKALINIWFEYDFDNIEKNNLIPNFFYAPQKASHPLAIIAASEIIFKTIAAEAISKKTLAHLLYCLQQLPEGGWVSQIGKMFARNEESLRVFIQQIPKNGIKNYLEKIGYNYACDNKLEKLLEDCYTLADQVDLDIDVSNITGDTIGLECSFNEMQTALDFLEYLFLNGHCTQEKYKALIVYLKSLKVNYTEEYYPFLSHFKIVYHPLKPFKTKAYLGFAHKSAASKIIRTKNLKH
ncbi:MAG: hypothetical protein ABJB05_06600 [Parafilimonas sp.]